MIKKMTSSNYKGGSKKVRLEVVPPLPKAKNLDIILKAISDNYFNGDLQLDDIYYLISKLEEMKNAPLPNIDEIKPQNEIKTSGYGNSKKVQTLVNIEPTLTVPVDLVNKFQKQYDDGEKSKPEIKMYIDYLAVNFEGELTKLLIKELRKIIRKSPRPSKVDSVKPKNQISNISPGYKK